MREEIDQKQTKIWYRCETLTGGGQVFMVDFIYSFKTILVAQQVFVEHPSCDHFHGNCYWHEDSYVSWSTAPV
jgi:hypothetical protein